MAGIVGKNKRVKKVVLRVMALVFALVLVVLVVLVMPQQAMARGLSDIQSEINEKKEQLETLEAQITANKNNKAAAEAALEEYKLQYEQMLSLIAEQELVIASTAEQLDNKSQQLNETIKSIQANRELYGERLRAIYDMNSTNAMMSTLLNVNSFSEMIQASDAMRRVSEKDTELLDELMEKSEEYERQMVELETSITQLTTEMETLQENRDWCSTKMTEMEALIASANYNITIGEQQTEATEDEIAELQEEYAKIFRQLQQSGSQKGDSSIRYEGSILWPVPGVYKISSWFGDPRSNTGYHYGIDIPSSTGTTIVAAASGTVITAQWHYSYGYYIVLDHGQGFRTLYAHNSQLMVTVGNYVTAGDTIALMGNTGNSYGSHLHFEVHENGTRQNPIGANYLQPVSA